MISEKNYPTRRLFESLDVSLQKGDVDNHFDRLYSDKPYDLMDALDYLQSLAVYVYCNPEPPTVDLGTQVNFSTFCGRAAHHIQPLTEHYNGRVRTSADLALYYLGIEKGKNGSWSAFSEPSP